MCADLNGAVIYSQKSSPVYLVFFGNQFTSESINNSFGTYGDQFSALSVRNSFSSYGGQFGIYSVANGFSTTPQKSMPNTNVIAKKT